MKTKIPQLIEKLCDEKHAGSAHCDVASSQVRLVNIPIPIHLFHELETIASEYNRDLNCLAGDFLTLALEEAIEHIPMQEKAHLHNVMHSHEHVEAELQKQHCNYDAGGS